MAQSTIDRIWNKVKSRYESDGDSSCGCGTTIEEADDESNNSELSSGEQ